MSNLYQQYYELREKRLSLQREVDSLEQLEKDVLYAITKEFPDQPKVIDFDNGFALTGTKKPYVFVNDWAATLNFIKAHPDNIDILQKRITESAVKQRWDNGLTVPGTEKAFKWAVIIVKE